MFLPKIEGSISISQTQAVIKLLEKLLEAYFLLNFDTKISSKAFIAKFKPILPSMISSNQPTSL